MSRDERIRKALYNQGRSTQGTRKALERLKELERIQDLEDRIRRLEAAVFCRDFAERKAS